MSFYKGLIKDVSLHNMPEGSWRNALNIIQDIDGNIINEEGTELKKVLDENFSITGTIECGNKTIIFSTNDTISEIGRFDGTTYTTIIRDIALAKLDFLKINPIHGEYYFNANNELIILWTDNINQLRVLNVDNLPFTVDGNGLYNDNVSQIKLIDFFPDIKLPIITNVTTIDNFSRYVSKSSTDFAYIIITVPIDYNVISNIRKIETCYFYIRYLIKDTRTTNWIYISNIFVSIQDAKTTPVTIKIDNLDNKYDKFELSIVQYKYGEIYAKSLGNFDLPDSGTLDVTYNGTTKEDLDIASIIIPSNIINTAKSITQLNNRLVIGNITTNDINYQKYANNITVTVKATNAVQNEETTFCPDEIYAFYIHLVYKDGNVSDGFHIPGRLMRVGEDEDTTTANGYTDDENKLYNEYKTKKFHLKHTGDDPTTGYVASSYWENEDEYYPTTGEDVEIWEENPNNLGYGRQRISGETTLAGKNVRHHKMPDFNQSNGWTILLKFGNSSGSDCIFFPDELKAKLTGYYISCASRDGQQSILDVSLVVSKKIVDLFTVAEPNRATRISQPSNLMIEQPNVKIHYLKEAFRHNNVDASSDDVDLTTARHCNVDTIKVVYNNRFEPRDNVAVSNGWCDAHIGMLSNGNVGTGGQGGNTNNENFVVHSHCRIIKNKYTPFNQQKLFLIGTRTSPNINYVNVGGGDMVWGTKLDKYTHIRTNSAGTGATLGTKIINTVTFRELKIIDIDYDLFLNDIDSDKILWVDSGNVDVNGNPLDLNGITEDDWNTYINTRDSYHKIYAKLYPCILTDNGLLPYSFNTLNLTNFPHRILRSIVKISESDDITWTTFLPNEYFEMVKNKGEISNLQGLNKELIIQTIRSTFLAKIKDVLRTSNIDAYLGEADIFDRQPDELVYTKTGYAGNQHQLGTEVTKYGFIFCDASQGKVFLVSTELVELSNKGISKMFKTMLKDLVIDNPYYTYGISITYNKKYNTLILSIKSNTQERTISYSFSRGYWLSYHSYKTNGLFKLINNFYSIKNVGNYTGIYAHNYENLKGTSYHTDLINPTNDNLIKDISYIEPILIHNNRISKLVQSVKWMSLYYNTNNLFDYEKTITSILLYNTKQFTGEIILRESTNVDNRISNRLYKTVGNILKDGLYRVSEDTWFFNKIRDMLFHNITINNIIQDEVPFIDDFGNIINTQLTTLGITKSYHNMHLFIDKIIAVRLINDNEDNAKLILQTVDIALTESK